MTAIWPGSLPQCPLRPFDEQPRMAKTAFQSDTGPDIERPKGTIRLSEVSMTFRMTKEQVATFEDFVFTDLAQATADFMFTHPRKHEQVRMRMTGGDRPYQVSWAAPGKYQVAFTALVIG
jgi:hypothetical protein